MYGGIRIHAVSRVRVRARDGYSAYCEDFPFHVLHQSNDKSICFLRSGLGLASGYRVNLIRSTDPHSNPNVEILVSYL